MLLNIYVDGESGDVEFILMMQTMMFNNY